MGLLDFLRRKPAPPAFDDDEEEAAAREPFKNIDAQQVAALREQGARVVDVRTSWEFQSYHIQGAEHLPVDQIRRNPSAIQSGNVIFVCESGGRSAFAASMASALGFSDVYNLEGGMQAWMASGLPTEPAAK